jgi:hypothetical protein
MNLNENINRIKQVMGLLNEQASGGLVTDDVYAAIGNIEKVFSKVDENDNIIGIPYDPRGKEENIKQAIKSTIGFDNWNKMDSKLKGQVYSFMFQSDSGTSTRLRWLAGLAQAIDPNINRLTIVDKPLNNPQVINAIKLVNDNINKIDYATYIKVVKNQYNNISETPNDPLNRLYIWGPRPEALDKLMNGESWDDVKKWWWNRIDSNGKIENNPYKNTSNNNNQQSVVLPIKTDSTKQIVPIVPSVGTIQTDNTSPVNQTNNSSSAQQTNTVPQQTYNYPDIDTSPFKPTNGDPWQYAYDGSKLLVKSPKTGNVFNLLDSNYFTTYPNSKLNTPEKLDNAKNEIKRLYGNQLGYK